MVERLLVLAAVVERLGVGKMERQEGSACGFGTDSKIASMRLNNSSPMPSEKSTRSLRLA